MQGKPEHREFDAACPRAPRWTVRALIATAVIAAAAVTDSHAQQWGDPFVLSASGSCPTFHCDAEGSSLMQHALPMPASGTSLTATNQLTPSAADVTGAIGCTSDDSNFVCLFQSGADAAISF